MRLLLRRPPARALSLTGKTFRPVPTPGHPVSGATPALTFLSDTGGKITGVYSDAALWIGQILARRTSHSTLEMLFHGITTSGALEAARAQARIRQRPDLGPTLHLEWQWLTGDRSQGTSDWVLADG